MSHRMPHHGRGGSHHVGRVRIAAAKVLNAAFPEWEVRPEDIDPGRGAWRTDWRQDVYRWELFTQYKSDGTRHRMPIVCGSWQRLTEFVRNARRGGKVTLNSDNEIYAHEPDA